MIFDSFQRTNWRSKQFNQTAYQFINDSAWPLCNLAREWINHWCHLLPADKAFVSRLKSKNDRQHLAAMFELLIFVAFKGGGLNILLNPVMRGKRTPDFSLYHHNFKIFLECTLAGNALEAIGEQRKKDAVLHYIEQLESFPFYINVDFKKISAKSISKRDFLQFLHYAATDSESLPISFISTDFCYCGQQWGLVITLVRKPEGAYTRSLGYQTQPGKIIDNKTVLLTALNDKKPTKYKIDDSPYIICIGVNDLSAQEEEFADVLFGPNYLDKLTIDENSNGFFLHKGQPINTSVSAVLFCEHLSLLGLKATNISLWHNPYATNRITFHQFPFKQYTYNIKNNQLLRACKETHVSVFHLLKINEENYSDGLRMENRLPPWERS